MACVYLHHLISKFLMFKFLFFAANVFKEIGDELLQYCGGKKRDSRVECWKSFKRRKQIRGCKIQWISSLYKGRKYSLQSIFIAITVATQRVMSDIFFRKKVAAIFSWADRLSVYKRKEMWIHRKVSESLHLSVLNFNTQLALFHVFLVI